MTAPTSELSTRRSALDPTAAALVDATRAWVRDQGAAGVDERQISTASAFARHCAPANATARQLSVAARLLVAFLSIDDMDAESVRRTVAASGTLRGAGSNLIRAWFADFEELRTCTPTLGQQFACAFDDYLRARREEVNADEAMPLRSCIALRARTIFTEPYFRHWLVLLDMHDPDGLAVSDALLPLATELAFLVNDLGSIDRDVSSDDHSASCSVVRRYLRQSGCSREEAVAHFIGRHNALAARYRARSAELVARAPSPAAAYIQLLTSTVVEGNRQATVDLVGLRYPGAARVLARLHSVLG